MPLGAADLQGVVDELLPLPAGHLGPLRLKARGESVQEAMSWGSGKSPEAPMWTSVYSRGPFDLGVNKPGWEAVREGELLNPNDMRPDVQKGGVAVDGLPRSFGEMWAAFEALAKTGRRPALVLLGRLLFRNAYFLDHVQVDGAWRYQPPEEVLAFLASVGQEDHMRLDLLVYLLELVALNEDVKYWTKLNRHGKPFDMKSVGRVNNLRTALQFVLIHLELASFADMIDAMTRGRGVAPVGQGKARALLLACPITEA